jgi:uncharacterized protein YcaQ
LNPKPVDISSSELRKIILGAQGLNLTHPFGKGPASVVNTIEHLGYVQIDTISVVERAHHHVLWSRNPAYRHQWLDQAQRKTRKVFEYWAHAAAFLPMKDYRFSLPVMEAFRKRKDRWPKSSQSDMKKVLARIRETGPLMSKDFESSHKGGTWWDWKPDKWALQRLYQEGRLMVSHREGFQRVYDLPERIIPTDVDTSVPTLREYYEFLILQTIKAQGVAARNELIHLRHIEHKIFDEVLDKLMEKDEIILVQCDKRKLYTSPKHLSARIRMQDCIHFLSPFDNMVIWRKRLKEIFDFDYTLECYVPAAKRKFGYFCLPVLWKDRFVGQADLKANRKASTLEVVKMHWNEPGDKKSLFDAWKESLEAFAAFNDCEHVKLKK